MSSTMGRKFDHLEKEIANGYIGKINPRTGKFYTKEEREYIGQAKAGEMAHAKGFGGKHLPDHVKQKHKHLPPVLKPWELI